MPLSESRFQLVARSLVSLGLLLCSSLFPTTGFAQGALRTAHVRLIPAVAGISEARLAEQVKAMGTPKEGDMDKLFRKVLPTDFGGRVDVTLIREGSMEKYTYAPTRPTPGKSIAVLGVRDQSSLDFQHHTELRAFWRDTVVVIDSLLLSMARLPGAKPGTMMLALPDSTGHPGLLLPSRQAPDVPWPVFVLSQERLGNMPGDTSVAVRLRLTCTLNKDLTNEALFVFPGQAERQELLAMATLLHKDMGLRKGVLVDHVEAYLRLWYGAPVRSNVQAFLRTHELMNE